MTEFVYGPANFLGVEDLLIVTRAGLDRLNEARACSTWGAYADLIGVEWAQLMEDYGEEVVELTGDDDPAPSASFNLDEVRGYYYVGDFISDPQSRGHAMLWSVLSKAELSEKVQSDPILSEAMHWSGGSPAGHVSGVTVTDEAAIDRLASILKDAGVEDCSFVRDEEAIRTAYGMR